jgi:hypothetical protein
MKRSHVVPAAVALAVLVALVAAGCGGTKTVTKTVTVGTKAGPGAPSEIAQFGYIKSLTRKGALYELRFDPAWLLSGKTANQASFEDTGSSDVPNDFYLVNEGHRLLTYLVPPGARVTVLTRAPRGTPITVAQLAQLVAGKKLRHLKLFEPLTTGFWILVHVDTVRSLDQQYFP